MKPLRQPAFPFVIAGVLAACGGRTPPAPVSPPETGSEAGRTAPLPSRNFLNVSSFPMNRLISGGVAKDGIPALTDPEFVRAGSAHAAYLQDGDLVLGVSLDGAARAYPHNIGWHHEIVNDAAGDRHLVVTLCPLTGTGMVFDGQGEGNGRLELGVSGLLFNNNLVMYDRRFEDTLYPQMTHIGIRGYGTEQELTLMPVVETTWANWKRLHPGTLVVSSASTGMYRPERYSTYPYTGYREPASAPMFPLFPDPDDNPIVFDLPPKEIVLGVRFGTVAKAYPFSKMGDDRAVINDRIADRNVLVVYDAAARMALAYSRDLGNRTLTFERVGSRDRRFDFMVRDLETGTTWDLLGRALAGELEGRPTLSDPRAQRILVRLGHLLAGHRGLRTLNAVR
ncbi:MAG: DUF3179 domain-containing protein [Gemmatimonadota bacterium]|nr:DUF3179 domain-containing protein [Gemmatimonadota bacterium]